MLNLRSHILNNPVGVRTNPRVHAWPSRLATRRRSERHNSGAIPKRHLAVRFVNRHQRTTGIAATRVESLVAAGAHLSGAQEHVVATVRRVALSGTHTFNVHLEFFVAERDCAAAVLDAQTHIKTNIISS